MEPDTNSGRWDLPDVLDSGDSSPDSGGSEDGDEWQPPEQQRKGRHKRAAPASAEAEPGADSGTGWRKIRRRRRNDSRGSPAPDTQEAVRVHCSGVAVQRRGEGGGGGLRETTLANPRVVSRAGYKQAVADGGGRAAGRVDNGKVPAVGRSTRSAQSVWVRVTGIPRQGASKAELRQQLIFGSGAREEDVREVFFRSRALLLVWPMLRGA